MWIRPTSAPVSAGPWLCAVATVVFTSVDVGDVGVAIADLSSPLLFLVFAVPLAVVLDDIGVFAAVASRIDGGRHVAGWLWALAATVVIVFNLDAAVVLLTPLYIRVARRHGLDVEAMAFQPALLACLASGVLPVSNLTNLIMADRLELGVRDFLVHLAAPSLVATVVGYVAYARVFHLDPIARGTDDPVDPRALRRGLPIIAFVLAGFTVGDELGAPAWVVAAIALGWASLVDRRLAWRAVPADALATASALGVLVIAAVPHLGLDRWSDASDRVHQLRAVGAATLMSNVANNLPTAMAGAAAMQDRGAAWPWLVGTNVGSMFVVTASLSTLLWRDTAGRSGVVVTAGRWSSVAVRVGAPALAAATIVLLAS